MKIRILLRRMPPLGTGLPLLLLALGAPPLARPARAQERAVASRGANVRAGQSRAADVLAHLEAGDTVTLVRHRKVRGYYDIRTPDGSTTGWVYAPLLHVLAGSGTPGGGAVTPPDTTTTPVNPPLPGTLPAPGIPPGPPLDVPGSSGLAGCGDGLWQHVYHPARLIVKQPCLTVTGTIVDATGGREPDGVRHEADGDTHGWLRVDPPFAGLLDAGNTSFEGGNLVFEIVCHYPVTQADARPACSGFDDAAGIPPVGTHVEITGTWVMDTNHGQWNEIHPVTSLRVVP